MNCNRCGDKGQYRWAWRVCQDAPFLFKAAHPCSCGAVRTVASVESYRGGDDCPVCLNTGLLLISDSTYLETAILLKPCGHCHGRSVKEGEQLGAKPEQPQQLGEYPIG